MGGFLKVSLSAEELLELHHYNTLSGAEIASVKGVSTSYICHLLRKYGIENRSNLYKIGKPSKSTGKFQPGHSLGKGISKPSPNKGRKFPRGKDHWNWKGGPKEDRRMSDPYYRDWRSEVFKRDHYTCQLCGCSGGQLNADHIKPWSKFPELRYELSNGRTLCVPCHRTTDTYGGRVHIQHDGGVMKSVTIT